MNPSHSPGSLARQKRRSRRGVALILVLASLVLLSMLILAFLTNVKIDLKTSKFYADGSSVKLLAQSATDLVMGEIRDATSNGNLAWASQPGMIRTYDTTGAVVNYYKLYSDDSLVTTAFNQTQTLVPDGSSGVAWYQQKGVYVDLNEPITVDGINQYPIVDGDSADLVSSGVATGAGVPSGAKVLGPLIATGTFQNYPQVSGFWLNNTTPVDPSSINQAPMPVKWLYVLKQGEIIVPDSGSTNGTVTFTATATQPQPSASNPIIGRMAFWTDDETSKVNINTASEGSYNQVGTTSIKSSFNDTPRVSTAYDLNMALCPSYQNEFQRYPGHPATVSLSSVFGNLTTDANYPENIYSQSNAAPGLAPRTIAGGSKEATVLSSSVGNNTGPALTLLGNRLYASTDELLFLPTLSGTGRALTSSTLGNSTDIDPSALKKAKFFITASSRAPDVTLFNTPRVGIWPISSTNDSNHRTVFDRLIAFCSSIGGGPANPYIYYFQRSNYLSQTEWKDIPRNQAILQYLRSLATKPIPGFGGTLAGKYNTSTGTGTGTEFDQILMEIFDYIRITNLFDSSLPVSNVFSPNSNTSIAGGEVVPSYDSTTDTKGFGRFETLSQVGLLFIAVADGADKQVLSYSGSTFGYGPDVATGNVRVQAALMFSLFDPAQGYTGLYPGCTLKVSNCNLTWDKGVMFPNLSSTGTTTTATSYLTQGWSGNLGADPIRRDEALNGAAYFFSPIPTSLTDTAKETDYPVGGNINFSGGSMQVQILKGSTVVQTINLTFPSGTFPVPTYVGPIASSGGSVFPGSFTDIPGGKYFGRWNVDSPVLTSLGANYYAVSTADTLESMQSVNGDLRLIAARTNIGSGTTPSSSVLFGAHPLWGTQWAHSFFENLATHPLYGATRGQLVASSATSQFYWQPTSYSGLAASSPFYYSGNKQYALDKSNTTPGSTCEPLGWGSSNPNVPPAAKGGVTAGDNKNLGWSAGNPPGDWDNGIGSTPDGPYINKSDEGEFTDVAKFPAYFTANKYDTAKRTGTAYFSPARQMPSPVMFGSLPTGVIDNRPWQTLLFHPDPTGKHVGSANMSGTGTASSGLPADHLLLDLFTMPVVEPYAISEPLSTAGRINMNYLMVPFTYINRDTGLRAVLSSQQILAIPNTSNKTYKQDPGNLVTPPTFTGAAYPVRTLRYTVNIPETLKGFTARFNNKDIFRSPSEICTLPLVPNDTSDTNASYANIATYWQSHQLTGDNSLERPYANIYPLLTTKSNTFTIHFRVQTLQPAKAPGADLSKWHEGTDIVTGEYRGSQIVERYIDPNDSTLPDFTSSANSTLSLAPYYKFRIVSTKQFTP